MNTFIERPAIEARLLYSQKEFVSNRNSGTGVDPVAVNKPGQGARR